MQSVALRTSHDDHVMSCNWLSYYQAIAIKGPIYPKTASIIKWVNVISTVTERQGRTCSLKKK